MHTITNTRPTDKTDWIALGKTYLELGWSIIPISNDKKPLISWKEFQQRYAQTSELESWVSNKNFSGFGLVTGSISGVVALDLDIGSTFDTSTLPTTLSTQTGSGGKHFYFKCPVKQLKNATDILPKTDFRGEGGYVVLPPSKHANGNQYYWIDKPSEVKLVDIPQHLLDLLDGKTASSLAVATSDDDENIFEGVGESKRNDSAAKVIGSLLAQYDESDWEKAAWPFTKAWNEQNKPPLSENELRSVFDSIAKNERENSNTKGSNQAQILVNAVLDGGTKLYRNQFNEPMLSLPEAPFILNKINSEQTKRLLNKLFWDQEGKPPGREAVNAAIATLEGKATFESKQVQVHNRVGRVDGAIYYNIGDSKHVVKITADGWQATTTCEIFFENQTHQKTQAIPAGGGSIQDILSFVNLNDDNQVLLVLTYLVVSLIPDIPRAMLVVHGDQGSAKSTLLKMIRELIDPSEVALLTPPSSTTELVQQASHHYALFLDNLSSVPTSLSDSLCRVITGDGFSKRQLYTNDQDVLYSYRRVVGVCGINQVTTKADLLDRSVLVQLERIPDSDRREEQRIWSEFHKLKPQLLGALFSAVSACIRTAHALQIDSKPRMADYYRYAVAAAQHLGFTQQQLAAAFQNNVHSQNEEALESSPVAQTIIQFMRDKNEYDGQTSELYSCLVDIAEDMKLKRSFPKGANWLWRKIAEVKPNLMAIGITVSKQKQQDGTYITMAKSASNATSATSLERTLQPGNASTGSTASITDDEWQDMVIDTLGLISTTETN